MEMPKAAMNKDNGIVLWEHQVRDTGKTLIVQLVSQAFSVKRSP